MAVKIDGGNDDDRVEQILADPSRYFAQARRNAQDEVRREMARQQKRPRRFLATS